MSSMVGLVPIFDWMANLDAVPWIARSSRAMTSYLRLISDVIPPTYTQLTSAHRPAWSDGHNVVSSGCGVLKATALSTLSMGPRIQM